MGITCLGAGSDMLLHGPVRQRIPFSPKQWEQPQPGHRLNGIWRWGNSPSAVRATPIRTADP